MHYIAHCACTKHISSMRTESGVSADDAVNFCTSLLKVAMSRTAAPASCDTRQQFCTAIFHGTSQHGGRPQDSYSQIPAHTLRTDSDRGLCRDCIYILHCTVFLHVTQVVETDSSSEAAAAAVAAAAKITSLNNKHKQQKQQQQT